MASRRLTRLLLAGAIILAVGATGLQMMRAPTAPSAVDYATSSRCDGHREFVPALWQDSASVYGPMMIRGCMVDDLRRRHPLRGRSRAEVVTLLGEPQPTSYFRDYDLVYWLGPEHSPFGVDSEWLVIRLDGTGRVIEDRLVTD